LRRFPAGTGCRELQAQPVENDASQLRLVEQLVPLCFLRIAAVEGARFDARRVQETLTLDNAQKILPPTVAEDIELPSRRRVPPLGPENRKVPFCQRSL